jgi:small subunit ribosomal protein S2
MNEEKLLVPQEQYLKSGIHIGTKFRSKHMSKFIYKTRPDGLSVLNLQKIDERLKMVISFLSNYAPEDIMIVSRRENGWKPVKAFGKFTGAKVFPGRYPPGILTNPSLKNFIEIKVLVVTDAWPDRNVIKDGMQIGVPIIALCDTNNKANNVDLVMPCNNKGKKSLGLLFYVVAKEYLLKRKLISADEDLPFTIEDFTEE